MLSERVIRNQKTSRLQLLNLSINRNGELLIANKKALQIQKKRKAYKAKDLPWYAVLMGSAASTV
jgi:hypothetical protein